MNFLRLPARLAVYCLGLLMLAFGIALAVNSNLGVSPVSSLPYVVSQFGFLSVGTTTILMHLIFICLQILLLRRQYDPLQLFQLPVALIFGSLTDLAVWLLQGVNACSYLGQWALCGVGILLVGLIARQVNRLLKPFARQRLSAA